MVAVIPTFAGLLHFHPHIHALVTGGAFTLDGEFLELPALDQERRSSSSSSRRRPM